MNILFSLSATTGISITMITAFISAIVLALISGVLGCFIVLRRLSLMGDALSHSVLPGVAISYMLNISIMFGATFFGLLAALLIEFIVKKSKLKTDTSIGIILSSFFALGVILITRAHSAADLNHILFGNILAVTPSEILQSIVIFFVVIIIVGFLYKELLITSFDPVMAKAYGLRTDFYHYLLMLLLTIFTVSALAQVGIVLVIAMLVTPAGVAYLWTNSLFKMILVASIVGVFSGIFGVVISFKYNFPTSSTIVLVNTVVFIISFLVSPKNGFFLVSRKEISHEENR